MKDSILKVIMIAIVTLFFTARGYGAEPTMAPPTTGVDSIAVLLIEQGITFYETKQWPAALNSFKLAAEIDPESPSAFLNAALVASEMGQTMEARMILEELVRHDPGHAEALKRLSFLKNITGHPGMGRGGGFVEFGFASLLGFIFVLGIAAYDVAVVHPFRDVERRKSQGGKWLEAA